MLRSICLFSQLDTLEACMVLPQHFTLVLPLLQKILQHMLMVDDIFFPVLEINYVLGVCNKKMVFNLKKWLHTYIEHSICLSS